MVSLYQLVSIERCQVIDITELRDIVHRLKEGVQRVSVVSIIIRLSHLPLECRDFMHFHRVGLFILHDSLGKYGFEAIGTQPSGEVWESLIHSNPSWNNIIFKQNHYVGNTNTFEGLWFHCIS